MSLCVDPMAVACKAKTEIYPEELPDGRVGEYYSIIIKINAGAMPTRKNLDFSIYPENSGLNIRSADVKDGYFNDIELYGKPMISGIITVHLSGWGYGYPPKEFDKKFNFKIR
ncbi:TPA: hypothetical protein O7X39_004495 [Salmonella enterica]|nr:hypothetical protein [Salmonella enterica subsp. enterica serovar Kotte]HDC2125838.1 hypothetical protein [Salmonella enterica]